MAQHANPTGGQESSQNKRKVHGWLLDEGWQIGEINAPGATWVLNATDEGKRTIIIAQPMNRADMVVIEGAVKIPDEVRRHLGEMPQHERNQFYFDLQYSLLQMGVEYRNVGQPFELPGVVQRIYSDALRRDEFVQRVILVRNAVVMILLKTAALMSQPPVAPAEPPPIGFRPS